MKNSTKIVELLETMEHINTTLESELFPLITQLNNRIKDILSDKQIKIFYINSDGYRKHINLGVTDELEFSNGITNPKHILSYNDKSHIAMYLYNTNLTKSDFILIYDTLKEELKNE